MTTTNGSANCVATFTTPVIQYMPHPHSIWTFDPDGNHFLSTSYDYHSMDNTTVSTVTLSMSSFVAYWQSGDLSKFNVDYASTLARYLIIDFTPTATGKTTSVTATTTPTATAAAIAPSQSETLPATALAPTGSRITEGSVKPGLSTGAKAGIGIRAAIGAILFCLIGFLFYERKLQSKSERETISAFHNDELELRVDKV